LKENILRQRAQNTEKNPSEVFPHRYCGNFAEIRLTLIEHLRAEFGSDQ